MKDKVQNSKAVAKSRKDFMYIKISQHQVNYQHFESATNLLLNHDIK